MTVESKAPTCSQMYSIHVQASGYVTVELVHKHVEIYYVELQFVYVFSSNTSSVYNTSVKIFP